MQTCDYPRPDNTDDSPRTLLTALVVCACTFIAFKVSSEVANTLAEGPETSNKSLNMDPASPTPEMMMATPTEEERAEIDAAVQACVQEVRAHPMILGKLSLFKLFHTHATNEEFKTLADSMPQTMQPHLQTIARLLALYPQECPRITDIALRQLGYRTNDGENIGSHGYANRIDRAQIRNEATAFLESCGGADQKFLQRMAKMRSAEQKGLQVRQVASAGK